ncbi:MAG TPA: hypothetical protein V6D00_13005 [Pantanalinema sp.]
MQHFFTFFDSYYLLRGMALYRSLKRHCPEFTLWIVCYDQACHDFYTGLALPEVRLITEADFEGDDPRLAKAKQERSRVEYYFTCTATIFRHLFERDPSIDLLTYLDADLYFYANPALMFEGLGDFSVAITPHRFPAGYEHLANHGKYNAGFAVFRNDARGRACLDWWRERSIEWCFDVLDGDRYANQKYLDQFPVLFQGVAEIQHPGVNLAPWNLAGQAVTVQDGEVRVGDHPLVFYHFHGLKKLKPWLFDPNLSPYGARPTSAVRRAIYAPYLDALRELDVEFAQVSGQTTVGQGHRLSDSTVHPVRAMARAVLAQTELAKRVLGGHCLVYR